MRPTRSLVPLVLAIVLFASCGGGDPQQSAQTERETSPSSTAAAGPSNGDDPNSPGNVSGSGTPGSSAPASTSGGTGASPATTTTSGGGSGEPRPSEQPGAARPAAPVDPGTYLYDTNGTVRISDGPQRPLPEETTLTVEAADQGTQRAVRDLRDQDGVGTVTEQILRYGADGVRLQYLKLQSSFAGVTNTYEFEPDTPPLVVATGATPGSTNTFTLEGDGVTIRTTATVQRTEQLNVANRSVSTIVLELSSQLSGELEGMQVSTSWIDTERSLAVKEDVDSDVSSGPVRVRSSYVAVVQSLDPR